MQAAMISVKEVTLKELMTAKHIVLVKNRVPPETILDDWLQTSFVHAGMPLLRRQDLPAEALLLEHYRSQLADMQFVGVVSHGWLAPGHPDPKGRLRGDIGVLFYSFLFWDFLSLLQVDALGKRTQSEEISFRAALGSMHLIYANPYWCVLRILSIPADAVNQVPYMNRGWCVFETCMAGVGARQLLTVKDGKVLFAEPSPLPTTPTRFQEMVKDLRFPSQEADSKLVVQLFNRLFLRLAAHEELSFFAWDDHKVSEFLEILPELTGVKLVKVFNWDNRRCTAKMSEGTMRHLNSLLVARGGELRLTFIDEFGIPKIWKGGDILYLTDESVLLIT